MSPLARSPMSATTPSPSHDEQTKDLTKSLSSPSLTSLPLLTPSACASPGTAIARAHARDMLGEHRPPGPRQKPATPHPPQCPICDGRRTCPLTVAHLPRTDKRHCGTIFGGLDYHRSPSRPDVKARYLDASLQKDNAELSATARKEAKAQEKLRDQLRRAEGHNNLMKENSSAQLFRACQSRRAHATLTRSAHARCAHARAPWTRHGPVTASGKVALYAHYTRHHTHSRTA